VGSACRWVRGEGLWVLCIIPPGIAGRRGDFYRRAGVCPAADNGAAHQHLRADGVENLCPDPSLTGVLSDRPPDHPVSHADQRCRAGSRELRPEHLLPRSVSRADQLAQRRGLRPVLPDQRRHPARGADRLPPVNPRRHPNQAARADRHAVLDPRLRRLSPGPASASGRRACVALGVSASASTSTSAAEPGPRACHHVSGDVQTLGAPEAFSFNIKYIANVRRRCTYRWEGHGKPRRRNGRRPTPRRAAPGIEPGRRPAYEACPVASERGVGRGQAPFRSSRCGHADVSSR
jgi:hypothetical protein